MQTLRARWVLPVGRPPIAGGYVSVDAGRVVACGERPSATPVEDLGDVALLPGFVNAHTHLELSWLAGRVPPAASMPAWIRAQLGVRAAAPSAGAIGQAAAEAIRSAQASGTVLFGDVSNTLAAVPALAASGADALVFRELLGFSVPNPAGLVADAWLALDAVAPTRLTTSVVAHAPYSVSPALLSAVAAARRAAPLAIHAGESAEELAFLETGRGPFRELLEDLGVWDTGWQAPRCGPIEYLDRRGYLGPGMLAVHGTHLPVADLARLREAGGTLVSCPRSNVWVGGGAPDAARFYASGVPVAIGTDSLASTATLHMTDELAALRRVAPGVPAARLIESATLVGARALGREAEFGTIAPGRRAMFAAVAVPALVADVEEYLVGGDIDAARDVRLVRPH